MSNTLAVAATSWGVLMALAPLLQLRVILRERDASGTSKTWIAVLLIGFVLWLSYGISTGSVPLIISNTLSGTVALILLVTALLFSNRREAAPADHAES
jgi:MtN3 and saliva related transmembrane protein